MHSTSLVANYKALEILVAKLDKKMATCIRWADSGSLSAETTTNNGHEYNKQYSTHNYKSVRNITHSAIGETSEILRILR